MTAPDIMFLDLMMPVVDGFSVIAAMRDNPTRARTKVVVTTAKELTSEDRGKLSGVVREILQKGSFGKDELVSWLRRARGDSRAAAVTT